MVNIRYKKPYKKTKILERHIKNIQKPKKNCQNRKKHFSNFFPKHPDCIIFDMVFDLISCLRFSNYSSTLSISATGGLQLGMVVRDSSRTFEIPARRSET